MAQEPSDWNPTVEEPEFWARAHGIVVDRINRLALEDRKRIAAAKTRTPMSEPEGGGWTRLWMVADGDVFELGRIHAAAFAETDQHPN
jgi:hypothetical protein